MTDHNGVNRIQPAEAPIAGIDVAVIASVDPGQFPSGIEIVLFSLGTPSPAPLGRVLLPPGSVLCVVPPGPGAKFMREQMRQGAAKQPRPGPSQSRPIGS